MKQMRLILMGALMLLGAVSCKPKTDSATTDTGAAAATEEVQVGEGLSEEEAKALLREEKVNAGTGIGKDDVETELAQMEEEIQAEMEGREPYMKVDPAKVPLVAKETFTPEKASSATEYERDMAVMKMIRAYIKEKEAKEAAGASTPADVAPTAAPAAADSK